jgi:hypothetical protein
MNRIRPLQGTKQKISCLLSQGVNVKIGLVIELMEKGVKSFLREALEKEITNHLDRGHYERTR